MAGSSWHLSGDFFGNCSCEYLRCPCPTSKFTEQPTQGWCRLCVVFSIDRGHLGEVELDGLNVIMVAEAPGIMAEGNWALGLIVDESATQQQVEAIAGILGGQMGGPMAAFAGWVGNFLGLEQRTIHVKKEGMHYEFSVPGLVEYVTEGTPGDNTDEPVSLDNVFHPANTRVGLARGVKTHLHVFGIDFDGIDDRTFGVFTRFDWRVD